MRLFLQKQNINNAMNYAIGPMLVVDTEKSLELATEMLDKLGVPVKDSDGNYLGIDAVLTDLVCVWRELDDNSKIDVFTCLYEWK